MNAVESLGTSQFVALRYEGPHVECTGITAVVKQELRTFDQRGGVVIAPWSGRMVAARKALQTGQVVDTGLTFPVETSYARPVNVRVLANTATRQAPLFYLAAEGYFEGVESPYDTRSLNRDVLFFGLAVHALVERNIPPSCWIWGADWQTVPAALLLHSRHRTALTLHNTFDSFLGDSLWQFDEPKYSIFRRYTALETALVHLDVITTVNRGYAYGLRNEVFHTQVMANHLQFGVHRIVGIDNANFVDPTSDELALADLIEHDSGKGLARLEQMQQDATAQLPAELAAKIRGKTLCIAMGRRSSQKLHDVVAEAVRIALTHEPDLPLFVFFATTHSDNGSPARLERIQRLCEEFPQNAGWSDGRVPYYPQLMKAGSYNLLCSLWEPHGGAFESTIVPIARAVDGLVTQINPLQRQGLAGQLADLWHPPGTLPSGLTFREEPSETYADDLRELLERSPASPNTTSRRMAQLLASTLIQAVQIRRHRPADYARMVLGAIRQQAKRSWLINFGGMQSLMELAGIRRTGTSRKLGTEPPRTV
jgi:hypothetical protein